MSVGWCRAARRRPPWFVWCIQSSPLATYTLSFHSEPHNRASHNTAPLHLTSLYNVPSVKTEEGFIQSRPVAVDLLKTSALWLFFFFFFSLDHSTFPPSHLLLLLLYCIMGWEGWTTNALGWVSVWIQLLTDAGFFFLIKDCMWFSIIPGFKNATEQGGEECWTGRVRCSVWTEGGGEVSCGEKARRGGDRRFGC